MLGPGAPRDWSLLRVVAALAREGVGETVYARFDNGLVHRYSPGRIITADMLEDKDLLR